MNPKLIRQFDLIPESCLGQEITIIGAGAIGSWTCLALAKMGLCNIRVYDFDVVSEENMNSQLYPLKAIGNPKCQSLQDLIYQFTATPIKVHTEKWDGQVHPGLVITAVDSMQVRRQVYDAYVAQAPHTKAIIDPRMSAENALLYVYKPMDEHDSLTYSKSLYSDSQGTQEPCTAKATIYTANLLAGLTVKAVKDQVTRHPNYLRTAHWNIADNELLCFNQA